MATLIIQKKSKREQNKERTEEEILRVATRLFSEKGIEATTIDDIVSNTSIARGTFYNYFKSLDAIWTKIISNVLLSNKVVIAANQKGAQSIEEKLYSGYVAAVTILDTPPLPALMEKNQAKFRESLYGNPAISRVFKDWEDEVRYGGMMDDKPESFIYLSSYILISSVIEIVIQSYLNKKNYTKEEIAEYLSDIFINGIFQKKSSKR